MGAGRRLAGIASAVFGSAWRISALAAADTLETVVEIGVRTLDALEDIGVRTHRVDPVLAILENMILRLDDAAESAGRR